MDCVPLAEILVSKRTLPNMLLTDSSAFPKLFPLKSMYRFFEAGLGKTDTEGEISYSFTATTVTLMTLQTVSEQEGDPTPRQAV